MRTSLLSLGAGAVVLLFASCVSPVVRRIEKNPQIYNTLSDQQKALVQRGQVEEGMSKGAVFIAWGKPDRVTTGSRQGKKYERWSYSGYEPIYVASGGFGLGTYCGRHGGWFYDPFFYSEPAFSYLPYEARRVEFVNDRVAVWSSKQ